MIECIICFMVGVLSGALVMSLCAASKNSNANIVANGDVKINEERKQVPRKIYHHEWVGIDGVPYDLCPTCKNNLCTTGMLANKKTKYCPECGQKLEWDDC